MHNSSGLPFDNSLHGSINRQYDNQLWMYENGFYYISTRYGRIGIVQSERIINAHMICTQKQMKDIRGMRIDKDRDDICINYTP